MREDSNPPAREGRVSTAVTVVRQYVPDLVRQCEALLQLLATRPARTDDETCEEESDGP